MDKLLDLTTTQLRELMASWGEPSFRASQLLRWVYGSEAASFDEMTDLPEALRGKLSAALHFESLAPVTRVTSADGKTTRTLFRLGDGKAIEAVLMEYDPLGLGRERRTVCVSTQAGCAFGCAFCATGQQGFERSLTPGEITDQVLHYARVAMKEAARHTSEGEGAWKRPPITNVVFMGMGEPLANYTATLQAIENLNGGFGLGARHMTVSTVGLVPQIKRLAREGLQVGLAISLHAPNDDLRQRLVPAAKKYPLDALLEACRDYIARTGRRVTFEYVMLAGVNDSRREAAELARLLRGLPPGAGHVNLIPANAVPKGLFQPSSKESIKAFQDELIRRHIPNTLRVERGALIDAGCGQLRGGGRGTGVGGRAPSPDP
ncbi:MAG: 23S rRNA (adenine(2503)-C(2))-methyltransferase RlmN [Chloroflexi bacterium]|nr:23S rRNA (adenine(2503)-C(2))-methyltransferase RlmN [Chloroflexota bacterium]